FIGQVSFEVIVTDGNDGFGTGQVTLDIIGPQAHPWNLWFEDWHTAVDDLTHGSTRVPRATDWDGDGDTDLLLLANNCCIYIYLNEGTAEVPTFSSAGAVQMNGNNLNTYSDSTGIALADMTGDGVEDLVVVYYYSTGGYYLMRVYPNTAPAGSTPVYLTLFTVQNANGSNFQPNDWRFDLGDVNRDGLPDLITGTDQSQLHLYYNVGTATDPRYDPEQYTVIDGGAYNLYPRLIDLSRDGVLDYVRGINWGYIKYWLNPDWTGVLGGPNQNLVIIDTTGAHVDVKPLTNGPIVDFADFNGDGIYDLISGGHGADDRQLFLAYGSNRGLPDVLADLEAIYDANPTDLGVALEADSQALLNEVKNLEWEIYRQYFMSHPANRQALFDQMAAHVGNYFFLQMNTPLDTNSFHHVPSIAGQNLIFMHQLRPDTPTHRESTADAVGLAGLRRDIFLNTGLHVGDNQRATAGQLESIRDFMGFYPGILFPHTTLTLNYYYGDDVGGRVYTFTGATNTIGYGEGEDVDIWPEDLATAAQGVFGTDAQKGDTFSITMGKDMGHTLNGYLDSIGNQDLKKRHWRRIVRAAGPDVIAGEDDWVDWDATQAHFQAEGFWNGVEEEWGAAWNAYWETGPGSAWNALSTMSYTAPYFLGNRDYAMAFQAEQHIAHSEARLVGAIDRWRRGVADEIPELKENLNEVVTYLDIMSCGMNKVVMYDTHGVTTPYNHATYTITHAWLERNDVGQITKITIGNNIYEFTLDPDGVIIAYTTNVF
nr:VCBS repeat-containing protein [Myxococcota bacterium]